MPKTLGVIFCGLLTAGFCSYAADDAELAKYELANVVKGLMSDKTAESPSYLFFKKYVRNMVSVSADQASGPYSFPGNVRDYGKVYRGEMPLNVNGKRFLAENMADKYSWVVYVAGSNAQPNVLHLKGDPVINSGGQSYFIKAGIQLQPIACDVIDSQNYEGYYFASTPGKSPIVLQINKSTGSGGVWYSYGIFWNGFPVKDLPQTAAIGACSIKD